MLIFQCRAGSVISFWTSSKQLFVLLPDQNRWSMTCLLSFMISHKSHAHLCLKERFLFYYFFISLYFIIFFYIIYIIFFDVIIAFIYVSSDVSVGQLASFFSLLSVFFLVLKTRIWLFMMFIPPLILPVTLDHREKYQDNYGKQNSKVIIRLWIMNLANGLMYCWSYTGWLEM